MKAIIEQIENVFNRSVDLIIVNNNTTLFASAYIGLKCVANVYLRYNCGIEIFTIKYLE